MKLFKKDITFIDLFAGIGGFRQALESYGAKCVFSSEIDKYAYQTYYANYGNISAGDIRNIPNKKIPPHHILCAGFPCQPFSISGKQKGFEDTTRGTLFFEIARIAKYHKPKILLLEYVINRNDIYIKEENMVENKSQPIRIGNSVAVPVLKAILNKIVELSELHNLTTTNDNQDENIKIIKSFKYNPNNKKHNNYIQLSFNL